MIVKANLSFTGKISMIKNEVREIADKSYLSDLLKCGYVTEIWVKNTENKRSNTRNSKA